MRIQSFVTTVIALSLTVAGCSYAPTKPYEASLLSNERASPEDAKVLFHKVCLDAYPNYSATPQQLIANGYTNAGDYYIHPQKSVAFTFSRFFGNSNCTLIFTPPENESDKLSQRLSLMADPVKALHPDSKFGVGIDYSDSGGFNFYTLTITGSLAEKPNIYGSSIKYGGMR